MVDEFYNDFHDQLTSVTASMMDVWSDIGPENAINVWISSLAVCCSEALGLDVERFVALSNEITKVVSAASGGNATAEKVN